MLVYCLLLLLLKSPDLGSMSLVFTPFLATWFFLKTAAEKLVVTVLVNRVLVWKRSLAVIISSSSKDLLGLLVED